MLQIRLVAINLFTSMDENRLQFVDIAISLIPRDSGSSKSKQYIIHILNSPAFEGNDICVFFSSRAY